jgi:hypothetical protein
MAPTNAEFIRRAMCEGFFITSLGGCYFQKISSGTLYCSGELVFVDKSISSCRTKKLKYFELKYDELHYLLSLYSKKSFFDYSLGGYSHRER